MEVSLKVGCLTYAFRKPPSIPLINLGRKWDIKMMMKVLKAEDPSHGVMHFGRISARYKGCWSVW